MTDGSCAETLLGRPDISGVKTPENSLWYVNFYVYRHHYFCFLHKLGSIHHAFPTSCSIPCWHKKKTPAMEVTGANPGGRVWRDVIMERAQKSRPHDRLEKTAFVHLRTCEWVSHYLLLTKWFDSWKRMAVLCRWCTALFKTKKAPPKRGTTHQAILHVCASYEGKGIRRWVRRVLAFSFD